jgi:hypothetical protein
MSNDNMKYLNITDIINTALAKYFKLNKSFKKIYIKKSNKNWKKN